MPDVTIADGLHREGRPPTFFTVSDSGFFLGTVALLNSVRATGHTGGFVVLDCGFSERQREILRPHCRLVPFDRTLAVTPTGFKAFPHLVGATDDVVIIDSDMIITHSLGGLFEATRAGRICAFADSSPSRWFAEWQELFDLSAAPRAQTYVNAGFLAFSASRWPDFLPKWWAACQRVWSKPFVRGTHEDPLQFLDQDALNALLMSEVPAETLTVLPIERGPFGALLSHARVNDPRSLSCSCRGRSTLLLHNSGGGKPWDPLLRTAWPKWRPAYVSLLRRVLAWPDVTIQVPSSELPPWLRSGLRGAALERSISAAASLRHRTRGMRSRGGPSGALG